jgi:hypothetical protein
MPTIGRQGPWAVALAALLLGCGATVPSASDPIFVRGGVIEAGVFTAQDWSPGEVFDGATAPQRPECAALFDVPLGEVSRLIAMGGEAPDTALAFSPDGQVLAIGSYRGEVLVVDGWTGAVRARRTLAETMVKRLAWSADGSTLFAAEQSPDAFVLALDPSDLSTRARVRMADWIGTSAPPDGDDLYGVYTLPAAYWMHAMPDGGVLVAAAHGWNDGAGVRQNRSVVLRLDALLNPVGKWPSEGAADAVFLSAAISRDQDRIAVSVSRSSAGPAPVGIPINGLAVLATDDLRLLGTISIPPLAPWYERSFIWDAIELDGERVYVGLGDGRLVVQDVPGHVIGPGLGQALGQALGPAFTHELGTPILAGEVPIAASVGHLAWAGNRLYAVTAQSGIPYGAASPELRPPAAHPNANALFAFEVLPDRFRLDWTWSGPHNLQGLIAVGDTLIVGAGSRQTDDRTDLFGALVFRIDGGGTGTERLKTMCSTEGPVFFRHAATLDGRIAVAEVPRPGSGGVTGAYRAVVFR